MIINQKCNLKVNNNKINRKNKRINEINIIVEISRDDINKIIYLLDNTEKHKNLKELNKNNIKLYIHEKEYKYTKYFKPFKEGIHQIKLLIFKDMINCSYIFYNCGRIKQIIYTYFNTNNIIVMNSIFLNCSYLSAISDIFL